jgi:hypothetical protein
MPVIGILGSMAAADFAGYVTAFREGLDEADFVEGQNVAIEYRWAKACMSKTFREWTLDQALLLPPLRRMILCRPGIFRASSWHW